MWNVYYFPSTRQWKQEHQYTHIYYRYAILTVTLTWREQPLTTMYSYYKIFTGIICVSNKHKTFAPHW